MNQQLLTEQEIADYGPDFVDVMRRVAAEVSAPLQAEIGSLRSQLGHVQQETGHAFLERMHRELGPLVPNWQQLNRDQRFIDWSKLPDQFSGEVRAALMQDAWNSGDAQRVAAFFQAFLQGGGSAAGLTAQQRLQNDGRNRYTRAQVQKFYSDCALGKWRGREDLRRALDADIQRAGVEGRIVDGAGHPVAYIEK